MATAVRLLAIASGGFRYDRSKAQTFLFVSFHVNSSETCGYDKPERETTTESLFVLGF